jgi:hypothetical protein
MRWMAAILLALVIVAFVIGRPPDPLALASWERE